MSKHNGTKPAFPFCDRSSGMSKREYFAVMALQGILASEIEGTACPVRMAKYAVEIADRMLMELDNE